MSRHLVAIGIICESWFWGRALGGARARGIDSAP
jgi:hypothetical protein